MATAEQAVEPQEQPLDKGLKSGALGLISSTVIATASVAPAYSIAATLVFVVGAVALQAPAVSVLAFIPMLLTSIGYSELNKADPDCGTTFTWATRAFGPRTGWAGGWAIVAADVLVMASLAQVAGQYVFLEFNAKGIGSNATSGWVLLAGVIWIVLMTVICYVGIEVSANFQKILLGIELTMLVVLSVVAVALESNGHAPPGHLTPSIQWLNPFHISSFSAFASGIILMVFIYWGWDTAVAVNEETKDKTRTPGLAAILSTILPTARTTLSMAAYKALPASFAKVHPRFMTPTVSTIAMGVISIAVYVGLNYTSNGIGVTGGLILFFLGGWSVWLDYDVTTENDYTMWTVPGIHWQIGGAFVIAVVSLIVGILFFLYCRYIKPGAPFFKKQTLTRATPTLVPDE